MGSILSAIEDDMEDYYRLCEHFSVEPVRLPSGRPDCYSKHASDLKKRRKEEIQADKWLKFLAGEGPDPSL